MGILGRGPTLGERPPSRRDRRQYGIKTRPPGPRRESERRAQMIILFVIVLVALVIVGIAAYGYYQTNVKPDQESVMRVGDRTFDMGYIERRLRYVMRTAIPTDLVFRNSRSAAQTALNGAMNEELDRQGSPELGISVTEDEIDAQIRLRLRIPETADSSTFAESYRNAVKDSGLRPSEYRETIAAGLLEEKLRQQLRTQIPTNAEQVRLRDIRVVTQEDAQKALERLQAGEDFALLAGELSYDTATKGKGGEMDWQARGQMPPEIESAVFALEVGQLSQPLYQYGTYYIYQMLEKTVDKEVTPDQRQQIEEQSLTTWRTGISQQVGVETYLSQAQFDRLVEIAKSEGSEAGGG